MLKFRNWNIYSIDTITNKKAHSVGRQTDAKANDRVDIKSKEICQKFVSTIIQ